MTTANTSLEQGNATPRTPWTASAFRRYRDGYAVAGTVNVLGLLVAIVGIVLFGIGAFGVVTAVAGAASKDSNAALGAAIIFPLSVALGISGVLLTVAGIAVRCLAQVTFATLDTAIHTSPFLDDDDRAVAMRLRT
ncbi:MAG: hypothetical protein KatS3mg104_1804 [Phycisphaerae bacterium]|jgi:hypothetical protein|nr:MAG: hypothetical protein KatS3mg104_1804 [Phycisphaerae bacterium]